MHSQIETVVSWVVYRRKSFFQLISKCGDWFTKTQQGTTLRPCINTTQGQYASFSTMESLFSSTVIQSLFSRLGSMCWMRSPDYGSVSAMPPAPAHTCTSSYSFRKNHFCEIESGHWFAKYIYSPRNISSIQYWHKHWTKNNNKKLHYYQLHKPFWLKPVVSVLCLFLLELELMLNCYWSWTVMPYSRSRGVVNVPIASSSMAVRQKLHFYLFQFTFYNNKMKMPCKMETFENRD